MKDFLRGLLLLTFVSTIAGAIVLAAAYPQYFLAPVFVGAAFGVGKIMRYTEL